VRRFYAANFVERLFYVGDFFFHQLVKLGRAPVADTAPVEVTLIKSFSA
jgi:hypothetical protein